MARVQARFVAAAVVLVCGVVVNPVGRSVEATGGANSRALWVSWVNGEAEAVLAQLQHAGPDRVSQLNRATALLHHSRPETAEQILGPLRDAHPGWIPALRALGRVQLVLNRPAALATVKALEVHRDTTSRDLLWAGQVHRGAGRFAEARAALAAAVAREPDLYLGWLTLGDVHKSLGQSAAACDAWRRAAALCATADVLCRLGKELYAAGRQVEAVPLLRDALGAPGGAAFAADIARLAPEVMVGGDPAPFGVASAPTIRAEVLRYNARFLALGLGRMELVTSGPVDAAGQQAWALRMSARSHPGYFFYRVRNEYNSLITDAGLVLRHRNFSDDSTSKSLGSYEMDYERGVCTWRYAEDGLLGLERLPLPTFAQDGMSVLALAREVARTRRSVAVLTAIAGTWKGTELRVAGSERLRWRDRDVETTRVDVIAHYRGAAGLSGSSSIWFSTDPRAVPYRTSVKLPLGSVTLDLEPEER